MAELPQPFQGLQGGSWGFPVGHKHQHRLMLLQSLCYVKNDSWIYFPQKNYPYNIKLSYFFRRFLKKQEFSFGETNLSSLFSKRFLSIHQSFEISLVDIKNNNKDVTRACSWNTNWPQNTIWLTASTSCSVNTCPIGFTIFWTTAPKIIHAALSG